jgi:hypothetical protein
MYLSKCNFPIEIGWILILGIWTSIIIWSAVNEINKYINDRFLWTVPFYFQRGQGIGLSKNFSFF